MDAESRLFLEQLFAGKPDELYVLLWMLPEKRSRWFQDVGDAIAFAESLGAHDLFVGVGLSSKDYGATHRCLSHEIGGIVGIWADIDLKSEAHTKALPASIDEALEILPTEFPPSFLINTGNGLHAWWLFREPLIFANCDERREAAALVNRWQTLLRLNAAARGWAFDRLADLARVLRVPGTRNCKDPANLKPVEIHSQTDRRYNPGDLAEYLDEQGVPDEEARAGNAQTWRERLADKALVIDPSAVAPEDLLARYIAADPRFRQTWLRQREDLKDESQSGYDMALANFGAQMGLSEQQTLDLLIHHRRIHRQRQRTKVDYFQRTIAKAFQPVEIGGPLMLSTTPMLIQAEPTGQLEADTQQTKSDSAMARALLCDQISAALGVRVLRIVKVTGREPTYHLELDSGRVEVHSVGKLVDQRSLRLAIAGAVDKLIPTFKPKQWQQIAQALLDALTIEDGGEETDLVGSARLHIENYLVDTHLMEFVAGLPRQAMRRPTIIDGLITVCSSDFQTYMSKSSAEAYSIKAIASMLTAIGASSVRVKDGPFRDQSRWFLPLAEFSPTDYSGAEEK